jgi:hypothetical protein
VSDHHARELWRRFLAEPSHENAYLWARTEARMRHEIPDPPVADLPLVALAPAFRCLAGGVAGRLERLVLGALADERAANGDHDPMLQRDGRISLRRLADADPVVLAMLEGSGSMTMFAAFFALRAFGVYRLAWEAWHLKAARVYPGALRCVSGRATDPRFAAVVRELAARAAEAVPA